MGFIITNKYYDKETNKFYVEKINTETYKEKLLSYDDFYSFANAIKKDFIDADLYDFDFENIDISKYDLSKAKIYSSTMIKLGIYNDSLYKAIHKDNDFLKLEQSPLSNITEERMKYNLNLISKKYEESENIIYYISDLHISNKILNKFKDSVNEIEIKDYCKDIALSLKESIGSSYGRFYGKIFILGDTSFNFKISKIFFEELRKVLTYEDIFVILGNHELWDKELNKKHNNVDSIIQEYKKMLNKLNIVCLQNELYIKSDSKKEIYSQEQINSMTKEEIRQLTLKSRFCVLGGIGYSGLNNDFNYNNGIYRNSIKNREEEIEQSYKFSLLYKKLIESISDKSLIVATHMPKEDWTNEKYIDKWIYLSGHTHKNYYCDDYNKHIYSDNQIGYTRNSFNFKFITSTSNYDIFTDYEDGIYEISKEQYIDFYKGLKISFSFKRPFVKLFMLKKVGMYCFLGENEKKELKFLNGGNFKNTSNNNINYYYDNLDKYSTAINLFMSSYENELKLLSQSIKSIGGSGRIHGCIVDIDFYNHIYLNPFDNTKAPYMAYSMIEKFVYKNIPSLLKYERDDLYSNYKKMIKNNNSLLVIDNNAPIVKDKVYVESTEMYRISRIIKGLQYTTNLNVVRLWNDTIINDSSKESGKLLISGIAYPQTIEHSKIEKRKKSVAKEKTIKIKPIKKSEEEKKQERYNLYCERIKHSSNGNIKLKLYNGAKEKMKFECLKCGNIWDERFDHFTHRHNSKCPKCKQ